MEMEKQITYTNRQIDCLKRHIRSGTVLESIPEHLPRDIYLCPVHNIKNGPLKMISVHNNRWNVIDNEKVKEMLLQNSFY